MKQTAMQHLWDWIDANCNEDNFNIFVVKKMSLEMEKEQIIEAVQDSWNMAKHSNFSYPQAEQYYNETYGSKGSHNSSNICDVSYQTEISDEEITKLANEHILYNDSKRQWVVEGMKLYREQLKQKQ